MININKWKSERLEEENMRGRNINWERATWREEDAGIKKERGKNREIEVERERERETEK